MRIPRIMAAAAGSGSGKTTIVCGMLAALRRRGIKTVGFKVGPDYIDPGYQRLAGQCPVYNLDTWLTGTDTMRGIFARAASSADIAVAEGVMGLYDGGRRGAGSSADTAKLLGIPVILVINARSVGESAAAVALGFREYDRDVDLRGVILNNVGSDSHRDMIAEGLDRVGLPLLGAMRRSESLSVPERHLGLLPTEENEGAEAVFAGSAAQAAEEWLDIDAILDIARSAKPFSAPALPVTERIAEGVRIAVARDAAFSFYYPDSLEMLEEAGAELVPFSPLNDCEVPQADGMLLGGGFPEMFAERLEANASMRHDIKRLAEDGMPILAECGGLMYLSRSLTDGGGRRFEMAGVIPGDSVMNRRLQAVGYAEAEGLCGNLLCGEHGATLRGHEFHFSTTHIDDGAQRAFLLTRTRTGAAHPDGCVYKNVLASYLHINFRGCPDAAYNFLRKCGAHRAHS